MKINRLLCLAPVLSLALFSIAAQAALPAVLPESVLQELKRQQLPEQALALSVLALDDATAQFNYQADRAMQPASTMKLLTSIVALDQLGPDFRASVELRAVGPAQASMQHPLLLKGFGSADFDLPALWTLLQQAHDAGIRHIPAVLIDRSWLTDPRPDLSASHFDDSPNAYYNLIPDAVFLQRSMTDLHFSSDQQHLTVTLTPHPTVPLKLEVELTEQPCAEWRTEQLHWQLQREPTGFYLKLQGQFPRHCQQSRSSQLWNRADYTRLAVQQLWQQISGQRQLQVLELSQLPQIPPAILTELQSGAATVLARHQSRTLAEQLREINKNSDNAMTRLMFLQLAQSNPSSPEQAKDAVLRWLKRHRIDATDLVLDNGSGLSRTERISPHQMTALLKFALNSPYAPELLSSLPLAGTDGTLKRRFVDSPLQGKARLKTGTLRNAVALAGLVQDKHNKRWIVAAMLNDEAASARGRPVLDALMLAIYHNELEAP